MAETKTKAGHILIPAPVVPYPGGRSQADFMRTAADHLEAGYEVGGYNVTHAVIRLLRDVAEALDAPRVPDQVAVAGVLWTELVRHEHDALRWEHPHPIPEWTQRIREQLDRPWDPDCSTCATGPGRYYRDRHLWPKLYGWTSEGIEVPL